MRQITCDGCSKVAEYGSRHDIQRSSFQYGDTELVVDLCSVCRNVVISIFPKGRVELTIREVDLDVPDFLQRPFDGVPPWDGVDRAETPV